MTGPELKTIRQRLGMTATEFGAAVGMSAKTIYVQESRKQVRKPLAKLAQYIERDRGQL